MFNIRKFSVLYRIPIGILLIGLGIWWGFAQTWWLGWLPIFLGLVTIAAHFLIGPISLLQHYVMNGDIEMAQKLLASVKKPEWLVKPVRSGYYMMKANFSAANKDLDAAEDELKKSLKAGVADKDFEGQALLQLGSISLQKGNMKDAYSQLSSALKKGLPDVDSNATAYLYLTQICIQRRDFKGAKNYFNKCKNLKPKHEQVVAQIAELKKYMARIPG